MICISNSTGDASSSFGKDKSKHWSKKTKHGALLDAEILADVYLEMQGGRQQGMQLKVKAEEESSNKIDVLPDDYSKKIYQLKEQEIKLHKEMLLRIKKSALEIKKF